MFSLAKTNTNGLRLERWPFFVIFAVIGYLVTVALIFAPSSWRPGPAIVFAICPAAIFTMTVDPSPLTVVILLAPINGAIYGGIAAGLRELLSILRTLLGNKVK